MTRKAPTRPVGPLLDDLERSTQNERPRQPGKAHQDDVMISGDPAANRPANDTARGDTAGPARDP